MGYLSIIIGLNIRRDPGTQQQYHERHDHAAQQHQIGQSVGPSRDQIIPLIDNLRPGKIALSAMKTDLDRHQNDNDGHE